MGSLKEDFMLQVGLIDSEEIRNFTKRLLEVAPEGFWSNKASKNHHPLDERLPGGNPLHEMRVTKIARVIADSCDLNSLYEDILISAALLHDVCRYGLNNNLKDYTVKYHPFLVRRLARINGIKCEYSERIFLIIEKHTGKWGDPPYTPEVSLEAMLHLADNISANAHYIWDQLN